MNEKMCDVCLELSCFLITSSMLVVYSTPINPHTVTFGTNMTNKECPRQGYHNLIKMAEILLSLLSKVMVVCVLFL